MTTLQEALRTQYHELKQRNPAFSLRAYARRLKVNSGVLSAVMNGRRRVSRQWLARIVPRMGLDPLREQAIQQALQLRDLNKSDFRRENKVIQLKSDEFNMIADGIHYAVLSLFELSDFVSSVAWMAQRLGSTPTRVRVALGRLQRLGLVTREKRIWRSTGQTLRTLEGIPNAAIKRFHEERLEEAKRCLFEVDVQHRDFLCSTIAIDVNQLPQARRLVREFLEKLEMAVSTPPRQEVYRISFQMFPVTQLSGESK